LLVFRDKLYAMKTGGWIDSQTSIIFIEFVVYHPNMERFTVGRIVLEILISGTYVPWSSYDTVDLHPNNKTKGSGLVVMEIIFILALIYYISLEISQMVKFRLAYLKDYWNYVDLIMISLSLASMFLMSAGIEARTNFNFKQRADFSTFINIRHLDSLINSFTASLAIITWLNILRYMRVIKDFGILFRVITKMMKDVITFIAVFMLFVVSFALAFHISIGTKIYNFRTWGYSILALIRMVVGDFDWAPIEETNIVYVRFIFYIYLVVASILLINLLIAMLNRSYSDVITKAASEYELEFASIVLSYGQEITVTEKTIVELARRKASSEFNESKESMDLEMQALEIEPLQLKAEYPSDSFFKPKATDVVSNDEQLSQSWTIPESSKDSDSTSYEFKHKSKRSKKKKGKIEPDQTIASEMEDPVKEEIAKIDAEKNVMNEIIAKLDEMRMDMRGLKKDVSIKFKDMQAQIYELRREMKRDDEIDFVYSDLF